MIVLTDNFTFDYKPKRNSTFGSKSKGKISIRSYSFQFEGNQKSSSVPANDAVWKYAKHARANYAPRNSRRSPRIFIKAMTQLYAQQVVPIFGTTKQRALTLHTTQLNTNQLNAISLVAQA